MEYFQVEIQCLQYTRSATSVAFSTMYGGFRAGQGLFKSTNQSIIHRQSQVWAIEHWHNLSGVDLDV